jgi:hypothetical protein
LEIDEKHVAAELFRRTNKALTITGATLNPTIPALANIDQVFSWAVVWGERRKAEMKPVTSTSGNGFNSSGCKYTIDQIEQIVREGPPAGINQSDVFHTIVGHYVGCGWQAERILKHLQQFREGIGSRYIREDRLRQEVDRSVGKYAKAGLPLSEGSGGWTGRETPEPEAPAQEKERDPELDEPEPDIKDDELDDEDDLDEEVPEHDPNLPRLYSHGSPDDRPLKAWLIKHLIPQIGHGLMSGRCLCRL